MLYNTGPYKALPRKSRMYLWIKYILNKAEQCVPWENIDYSMGKQVLGPWLTLYPLTLINLKSEVLRDVLITDIACIERLVLARNGE